MLSWKSEIQRGLAYKVSKLLKCIALSTFPFSGCVAIDNHPYPEGWERLSIPEGVCTDITGTFDGLVKGIFWNESKQKEWADHSLDVTHVAIELVAETLKVSAWSNAALVAQRELRKDEKDGYACTKDGIVVKRGSFLNEDIVGYSNEAITLFKATDGTLILKSKQAGGGLGLGIIPFYGSGTYWQRYRPYVKK